MRYAALVKLDHVALSVHDVEAGLEVFKTLGFELKRRGKHYANAMPTVFITNPATGVDLELIEVAGQPAPGFLHLAFQVEDLNAKCVELEGAGYVFEREPFFNEGNRTHMAFMRHPVGLIAQINQPEAST
jgi:catechol 2,3-dioxygenase-like lactoylglutathione lyase family enzyme